jgi:hypothetical protein
MPSSAASSAICCSLQAKAKLVSVISTWKCLRIRQRFRTSPRASPISALPSSVPCSTRVSISASGRSVAASSSLRLRARSTATSGLRQTTSRSSG